MQLKLAMINDATTQGSDDILLTMLLTQLSYHGDITAKDQW
jgi:hypothetical protein